MEASIDHTSSNETGTEERSSNGLRVREAEREDFPMILMGAEVMWRESVYSHMDFNEEKLWARFDEYTSRPDKRLFLLEHHGIPVGGLFASLGPTFFGDDLVAYEETCFVLPEARELGGFSALLAAFESWAVHESAKALVFDITSRVKTRRTEEKLEASGYEYAGATMVKRV